VLGRSGRRNPADLTAGLSRRYQRSWPATARSTVADISHQRNFQTVPPDRGVPDDAASNQYRKLRINPRGGLPTSFFAPVETLDEARYCSQVRLFALATWSE